MKKLLAALILALMPAADLAAGSCANCYRPVSGLCPSTGVCKVATLGDSLLSTNSGGGDAVYVKLQAALSATCVDVDNFGANGKTSTQAKTDQWDASIEGNGYDVIYGLVGVNDIQADVAASTIVTNITAIWDEAEADGVKVVWGTVLPFKNHVNWTVGRQTILDTLNSSLATEAASRSNVTLIDFYGIFEDPSNVDELNPGYDSGDGLHPNDRGRDYNVNSFFIPELIW